MDMRVALARRFGGPEVLEIAEVPDPVAGPGQVVVDVAVADTLFVETQIRQGLHGDTFGVTPPFVPGGAVAGRVGSVGDGVDPGWVGREVATRTVAFGGYAERTLAAAEVLVEVPAGLDLKVAAALLHDGLTGMSLFEAASVQAGDRVLVTGAAGGMGVLLVQLARNAGAQVIGAARGEAKLGLLRELGADAVVDYSEAGWTTRVQETTGGAGPSIVFDGAGGRIGREAFEIVARGGWFSAHGAASGGFAPIDPADAERAGVTLRGIQHVQLGPGEAKRLTALAFAEATAGRIKPAIGRTFALDEASDAHIAIESRSVPGKTLLLV